jgi:hypothetical protein
MILAGCSLDLLNVHVRDQSTFEAVHTVKRAFRNLGAIRARTTWRTRTMLLSGARSLISTGSSWVRATAVLRKKIRSHDFGQSRKGFVA